MKNLLILTFIAAGALVTQAETTNVTVRVTVENSVTGTNVQTLTLKANTTVADQRRIDGLVYAYQQGTAGQAAKDDFAPWLFSTLVTQPVVAMRDAYLASGPVAKADKVKDAARAGTLTAEQQALLDQLYALLGP